MEVRLDSVGCGPLPKDDVFLSFRVGDVQKQSRFSKSRTYRFPDPGAGRDRFGRLEVYRRVGALTVSLDAADDEGQDVFIPCDLSGAEQLGFRMAVRGGAAKAEALPNVEQRGRASKRMDAAQRYMTEHKLEEILADAMREVLQSKPTDPLSFLSGLLLKRRKGPEEEDDSLPPIPGLKEEKPRMELDAKQKAFEKLPPLGRSSPETPSKAAPPPPAAPPPAESLPPPPPASKAAVEGAGEARPLRRSLTRSQRKSLTPEAEQAVETAKATKAGPPKEALSGPTVVEPVGSRAYYAAHVVDASGAGAVAGGLASLYAKFPPAEVAKPAAPESPIGSGGFGAFYSKHLANNTSSRGLADLYGKFAAARTPAPAAQEQGGFKAYYAENVVGNTSSAGLARLYDRFAAPAAAKSSAAPQPGSREYYAANVVGNVSSTGLARLYDKFAAPAAAKSSAAPQPGSREYYAANVVGNVSSTGLARLYDKFEAPAAAKSSTAPQQQDPGSREYYAANVVCNVSSAGLAGLYAKFEAFNTAASRADAPAPAPGSREYYAANVACNSSPAGLAGLYGKFEAFTKATSQAEAPAPGSGAYYVANVVSNVSSTGLAGLYGKFEAFAAAESRAGAGSTGPKEYNGASLLGFPEVEAPKALDAGPVLEGGVGAYCGKHMPGSCSSAMAALYSKFPAQGRQPAAATPGPAAVLEGGGFASYYQSNLLGGEVKGAKVAQDLLQKFGSFAAASARSPAPIQAAKASFVYQASVGSWLARTPAQVAPSWCSVKIEVIQEVGPAAADQAVKPNFAYQASVGSWLARTPAQVTPSWCSVASEVKSEEIAAPQAAKPSFVYRASVGSWLTRTPAQVTPSWCSVKSEEPAPEAPPAFRMKPSVGTWLARKKPQLQPERTPAAPAPAPQPQAAQPAAEERSPWRYRPSVGSWLTTKPAKIEAAPVSPKRAGGLLARRQDSLLKMEPIALMAVFEAELEAKDREIEDLRRKLLERSAFASP